MNSTERVLEFIQCTQWDDLPVTVQHGARRCLLDLIGALVAGTETPVARLMAGIAAGQFGGDEATVLCGGRRVSVVGATLANGFAANALDIDDGYRPIKGHPGACVLPPLLAASEWQSGVAGREFLTVLVIGYEVAMRAGLIRHATSATYHSSGSWGAIAGAAVAGRILGLSDAQLVEAPGRRGVSRTHRAYDERHCHAEYGQRQHRLGRHGRHGLGPHGAGWLQWRAFAVR